MHGPHDGLKQDGEWISADAGILQLYAYYHNHALANYAPVKGELQAVTYRLSKTKYYTLGYGIIICVDLKQLQEILNKSHLKKVNNSRFFRLKQKIL